MYFVTGTDTDCGKTLVSAALLTAAAEQLPGCTKTLGIKPVASGCRPTDSGLRNPDAELLMAHASSDLPYHRVNPLAFEPAIAPHIAAARSGVDISPETILALLDRDAMDAADFCLLEGAGGWRLPLGQGRFMPELVQALEVPVILVVGMKLGCLNHAMLTQEAIKADGLRIAGWVANRVDAHMACFEENLQTLREVMDSPCLGVIPHLADADPKAAAACLDLSLLKQPLK
ncbi:dethiobiotin synthase [Shewanella sedimentimangrovi]|uniref:ATP-dependent dethiobiotin synthetase BioD n=1 Tax=Shewanella sedimentimangrovi TaxID=2814293 RepID=A0ABX7R781_9GAMM|nr:dethiobiotin synthase [Shewanella sedimentimangrovi]QSX39025.1 dethiobiotin synthase [Shewanella sedimentimangrovi]